MNHMELSDELRRQLLESAAWGKAGVTRLDEKSDCASDGGGYAAPAGSKTATKGKKANKPKEMENQSSEYEDAEGAEELEETTHICPLCTSELNESLDPDVIMEHLDVVMSLVDRLSQLNEGDEDLDEIIDETLADALFGQEEIEEEG